MYVGKWWMYSVVVQKLLKKGDNEDLKTIRKYLFKWYTKIVDHLYLDRSEKGTR